MLNKWGNKFVPVTLDYGHGINQTVYFEPDCGRILHIDGCLEILRHKAWLPEMDKIFQDQINLQLNAL